LTGIAQNNPGNLWVSLAKMNKNRIFTFWEPRGSVPAYLRLCRDTWTLNCPEFEVIVVNYDNLEHYAGRGVLDIETLKTVGLHIQKDAILFAVLAKNGGIFMDMDTIVFSGLTDIQQRLETTELITFHMHLGFVAARQRSALVLECLEVVQHRLATLREQSEPVTRVSWDFFGNSILDEVIWNAAHRMSLVSRTQGALLSGISRLLAHTGSVGRDPAKFLNRLDKFIATQVIFRHLFRKHYLMLSRDRQGFIAERVYGNKKLKNPLQKYRDYWFTHNSHRVLPPPRHIPVIGLHNSWTPQWYSSLSESEVLEHECLLSRTLGEALNYNAAH